MTTAETVGEEPAQLAAATLCEAFQRTVAEHGDDDALRTAGDATAISWRAYGERVREIACGLAALGVGPGDTVALLLVNRPEFNICDTAAMHLGATPFSIYSTSAPEQIAHVLANARARVVITEASFVAALRAASAPIEHLVVVDGAQDGALSLGQLTELEPPPGFDFDAAWRAVRPDDVLTIIYTSGTTGPPKGAQLTHANMLAQLRAIHARAPQRPGGRGISWLPSAHLADRWATHYTAMAYGMAITCVADPRAVMAALPDVRPTAWGAVPRIWEKLKLALEAGLAAEPDLARRTHVEEALTIAREKVRREQAGEPVPDALAAAVGDADATVFAPLRALLGLDRVEVLCCGGAPISADVLEFFLALGLPICELWGMSEAGIATINPPDDIRVGSVGTALPGVELRLADDGELLVRGPLVMPGYRDDPARTAEAIDPDGWLHTGDVATIDADGYVRIVDRKKELIINAAGKNMSPANIEAALKAAGPLIGQACVVGDARPFNVALLLLDPDAGADPGDPSTRARVQIEVDAANARLARVEQIKRFHVVADDWPAGGAELTPTMKLKRRAIAARYAREIEELYA